MDHETMLSSAKEIAGRVLAPASRQNDKEGRFSTEAVEALGKAGLLGDPRPGWRRAGPCPADTDARGGGPLASRVAADAFVFADGPLNELAPEQVVGT